MDNTTLFDLILEHLPLGIAIEGVCDSSDRRKLIEEAITDLQEDPENWAKGHYYGIKNYAGFGDQRSDHPYGYGPSHGSIVFRISRTSSFITANKDLYIRILLWVLNYKGFENNSNGRGCTLSLTGAVNKYKQLTDELVLLKQSLINTSFPDDVLNERS